MSRLTRVPDSNVFFLALFGLALNTAPEEGLTRSYLFFFAKVRLREL